MNLTGGGLSGGYQKYLRRLVPRLREHPDVTGLEVFAPEAVRDLLSRESWQVHGFAAGDPRGLARLKRMVSAGRPDVVFIPTAAWADFDGAPVVVMVRNMEPLEVPFGGNPPAAAITNLARRALARRAVRRARRVIAVSQHVRAFLTSRWSVPDSKVGVVYHGVDDPSQPPDQAPATLATAAGPFVFAAGSIRPARGLVDLLDALARLHASGVDLGLVVAGRVDRGMNRHFRSLARRAAESGIADRVRWAAQLDAGAMRWCYAHAAAFVMTSRVEACPNVALEAMSHGCLCISTDAPPMPEFFDRAAAYYRRGDAVALAGVLRDLLTDPARARQLRIAAAGRARSFDWDTTAVRTVQELAAALR